MFMSELDEAKYIEKLQSNSLKPKASTERRAKLTKQKKSLRFYDGFLTFKNTGMRFGQMNCQMTLLDAKTSLRF